jgi:hypothetical protein
MSDIETVTKMSESVQTETITPNENKVADTPSTAKKSSILRHRKIPSTDLNNVSIFLFIGKKMYIILLYYTQVTNSFI